MRKMRDSGIEWVGAIPAAWGVHRIASHFQEIKEKNTANAYSNALQFKMGKIIAKPQKWDEDETNETYSAYTVVHPNTIMINGLNLEFDFVTQRVARVECNGIITSAYIALSPRDDINAEYICYLLKSYDACRAFHSMGRGLRKILSYSELKNKPIVVPPLAEQERIAAFLDAECAEIDAVLEKTRASIEEYKKLKQAVITQAVTKGVRGDRPMKDSGIEWVGEIANEFAVYKFKYLIKTPMQYGANEAGITFDKTLPRYIRITDITSDGRLKQDNRLCIEDTVAKPYILQDGDLLFARSGGTVGKSFLYKQSYGNAAFAGYLIRAVVNRTIAVPEYVYYYTNSSIYDTWKNSIFIQSTIQNIGADRYSNMPIIVPNNIEEQRSIVEYLNERCVGIDALIRKKQQYLTEIENYKKSLIYEYVTGKKEVHPL